MVQKQYTLWWFSRVQFVRLCKELTLKLSYNLSSVVPTENILQRLFQVLSLFKNKAAFKFWTSYSTVTSVVNVIICIGFTWCIKQNKECMYIHSCYVFFNLPDVQLSHIWSSGSFKLEVKLPFLLKLDTKNENRN